MHLFDNTKIIFLIANVFYLKRYIMKKAILTLFIFISASSLFSATFTYTYIYDAAGNRTARTVVTITSTGGASIYDNGTKNLKDGFVSKEKFDDKLSETSLTLYPNPTRGELVLRIDPLNPEVKGSITVVDMNGRIVYETTKLYDYNDIDLENVVPGNYILKLIMGSDEKIYSIIRQ
jgi:hypothetical protein